jgi:hypothetical protein
VAFLASIVVGRTINLEGDVLFPEEKVEQSIPIWVEMHTFPFVILGLEIAEVLRILLHAFSHSVGLARFSPEPFPSTVTCLTRIVRLSA